jgi:proline dehydrogenase
MPVSFNDTQIAFSSLSNTDLNRSYWLFKLVSNPSFVSIGKQMTDIALKMHLPIKWIIKPTIFKQFCGGETVEESREKVRKLGEFHVKSILDYSIEGKESEADFDKCTEEIMDVIAEAKQNKNIGFSVFKPTGVARFALLEKISSGTTLSSTEQEEYSRVKNRFDKICKLSHQFGIAVFIDAEESWIQAAVDNLVDAMMGLYNQEKAIVYNTFQLYRKDRLDFLKKTVLKARQEKYVVGAKLVRGAYMEKERKRATIMGYSSPINDTKHDTDDLYNNALRYSLENLDSISFCCASHNEQSARLVLEWMNEKKLPANHPHVYFSQLLGMSDHITYNLAHAGYNVSKYVPYGPVRDVVPYLIRRAQENTSVKGQTGRELALIIKEKQRRRSQ